MEDLLVPFLEVESCSVWPLWVHVVAGASTKSAQHNSVPVRSEELMLEIHWSSVQVLRVHIALRIISLLSSGASLLVLRVPILHLLVNLIDFHELQNHGIAISSHVGVIGGLVVVTQ